MLLSLRESPDHVLPSIPCSTSLRRPAFFTVRIPQEVCEHIINWCAEIDLEWEWHRHPRQGRRIPNRRLVAACALVCRSWLPRSRNRLLSSVSVLDSNVYSRFSKSLRVHIHLGAYVEVLKLGRLLSTAAPNAWMHLLPIQLSSTLSGLPKLSFTNCPFPTHSSFVMLLSGFRCLSVLTLDSCSFVTFTDLARMLLAFRSLSSLTLDSVNWQQNGYRNAPYKVPRCARLKLRTLVITRVSPRKTEVILRWLFLTPSVASFESLQLPCFRRSSAAQIRKILHLSRSSLQKLRIKFDTTKEVDGTVLTPLL